MTLDEDRRLQAELSPPPDGPQARARGEIHAIDSDGGVTLEVTVRQLAVPQDSHITVVLDDRELMTLGVGGGSGSSARTLDPEEEDVVEHGAEVTIHLVESGTVEAGDVIAVSGHDEPLLYGVLREEDESRP